MPSSSYQPRHRERTSSGSSRRRHVTNRVPRSSNGLQTSTPTSRRRSSPLARAEDDSPTETTRTTSTSTKHAKRRRRPTSIRTSGLRNERPNRKSHVNVRRSSGVRSTKGRAVRSDAQSSKTRRTKQHATPQPVANPASKQTTVVGTKKSTTRIKKENERSSDILSFIFKSPKVSPPPEKKITCLTCLSDDIPISRSAKLACSHRMCHSCLKRIFTLSIKDPQHMPPRCCTSDHIPLKHVERLFDTKFKVKWNRKYQEFTTKNKIYCPVKGCGEWIKPSQMSAGFGFGFGSSVDGRKSAKCSRCKTKICCACKGKWHGSKTCPDDEETKKFIAMAQQKGWQRCYNCAAIVELKEGCNHMTCRCTAEFCMICGSKWKTCECPWFNYTFEEDDHLNYMDFPRLPVNMGDGLDGRVRANEIPRRRDHFQFPDGFFRRFQLLDVGQDNRLPAVQRDDHHVLVFGNANNHFLNEHFIPQRQEHRSR